RECFGHRRRRQRGRRQRQHGQGRRRGSRGQVGRRHHGQGRRRRQGHHRRELTGRAARTDCDGPRTPALLASAEPRPLVSRSPKPSLRRRNTKLARAWDASKRFMTRAMGPFPLTPLGLLVLGGCAFALLEYGIERIDLVLLVIGALGLGIGAFGLLATITVALILWVRQRRRARSGQGESGLDVECG